jgi:type II secretory pathway component PulK
MNTNSNKKGLVLVGVLWIVIVLTAIVAILGRKSRMDSKIVLSRTEAVRTKWAARAGIERAVAILNEDEKDIDGIYDLWYSSPEDFNDFQIGNCRYNVIVSDESGKLDINTASFDQLMGLPNMFEDIADAIIDWRDSDSDVNGLGTETGYYENLTYPYPNRNAPFRTIRELLLVNGVTDELFYGEDTNLNGKLDYNEMDGDINPPDDNGDSWLDQGWAAYITCYTSDSNSTSTTTSTTTAATQTGLNTNSSLTITYASNSGQTQIQTAQNTGSAAAIIPTGNTTSQTTATTTQTTQTTQTTTTATTTTTTTTTTDANQTSTGTLMVNINTASEVVLAALMGGSDQAYAAAQAIIGYRENTQSGIEDVSELTNNNVISSDMLTMIQDYITVSSNIYKITCTATADRSGLTGTSLRVEAVIDRSTSPYKVLYWYQGASN